ncbi:MAG TPA: GAF domain-containing protein [Puia sp.]|nr:GAF domain-containing protein [Puia sp.]
MQELEGAEQLDVGLSFRGFVNFLKERRLVEKTMRVKFLDMVIHYFEQRLQGGYCIPLEEIGQYGELLELMFMAIFPPLADERETAWALSVPVTPVIFYGTDPFYDKLRDPVTHEQKACMMESGQKVRKKVNLELIYSLILKRLYNFEFAAGTSIVRSLTDKDTGLAHFYKLNLDLRFVEIVPKGILPGFDPQFLNTRPPLPEALDWLKEHLPLSAFRFEGISALTVTDITTHYVVESIKGLILNPERLDKTTHRHEIMHYLSVLAGNNDIRFGGLPLFKVNGRPVYSEDIRHHTILSGLAQHVAEIRSESQQSADVGPNGRGLLRQPWQPDVEETYLCMVDNLFREPRLILYETVPDAEPGEPYYLEPLRQAGIHSYALVPVYYNNRLAGVLELSSYKPDCLNRELLAKLDVVIPLLAQLLQHSIDEFDMRIKAIVKENFTSIQPAVEWKFNEIAWHYDRMLQQDKEPELETVYFKDVYPLYGAIDIRNSTMERNSALRRDLETQFRLLCDALAALQRVVTMQLVDEMMHQTQKWQSALAGALTTADELNLNAFLKDKVGTFLTHFAQSRPELASLMDRYLMSIDEETGDAFAARRSLESCIQLINRTVNESLERSVPELQASYPSYFEKFRTDGVEYDLYIGGSIAPDRPFDLLYLRNLRLWQLTSMATIARDTHNLLKEMATPLQTTQLIFVHSSAIDISFRKDERRFDVEGGYNIRYQVVKKRIDKVRVQETGERLTQPGMIAIIYFNDREAEEYEGYIRYLQEKGMLGVQVEHLELEELQGVSGLRALRVGVLW